MQQLADVSVACGICLDVRQVFRPWHRIFHQRRQALAWFDRFYRAFAGVFHQGGHVYWAFGPLSLTHFGIVNGFYVFCRFVLIIFMSTLLTLTTAPLEISDAIESLLKPLKAIKVPVYEISLMLSIALRFVPTLMDETEKIMNAQRSRGVNFSEGTLMQRIKAVIPLLIPLFVSSFNRAEELATAMEARGYRGGEGRTKYRVQVWTKIDTIAVILFAIVTILLFVLRKF